MVEVKQFEKYKLKDDLFGKISGFEVLEAWAKYSTSVNGNGFDLIAAVVERASKTTKLFLCTRKKIRHLEAYRKFYVK